jgi:hypothetical protein
MIQDKKLKQTVERFKKRVHKFYPGAFVELLDDGGYVLVDTQGTNLFDEYFIQPAPSYIRAWELGILCAKTTQNFNRTHPDRLILSNKEERPANKMKRRRAATAE